MIKAQHIEGPVRCYIYIYIDALIAWHSKRMESKTCVLEDYNTFLISFIAVEYLNTISFNQATFEKSYWWLWIYYAISGFWIILEYGCKVYKAMSPWNKHLRVSLLTLCKDMLCHSRPPAPLNCYRSCKLQTSLFVAWTHTKIFRLLCEF